MAKTSSPQVAPDDDDDQESASPPAPARKPETPLQKAMRERQESIEEQKKAQRSSGLGDILGRPVFVAPQSRRDALYGKKNGAQE